MAETTNARASYNTTANFNTGTNSNTQNWAYGSGPGSPASNGEVTLKGMFYNWAVPLDTFGALPGETLYGNTPGQANVRHQLNLPSITVTDLQPSLHTYYHAP